MRSWDKYCEDTEKAFVHFIDCIDQLVYIRGYLYHDATDSNQLNTLCALIGVNGLSLKLNPVGCYVGIMHAPSLVVL